MPRPLGLGLGFAIAIIIWSFTLDDIFLLNRIPTIARTLTWRYANWHPKFDGIIFLGLGPID
jgi:hypothetical protein